MMKSGTRCAALDWFVASAIAILVILTPPPPKGEMRCGDEYGDCLWFGRLVQYAVLASEGLVLRAKSLVVI